MDLDSFLTSLYVLVDDRISEIRGLPAAMIRCCGLLREAAFSWKSVGAVPSYLAAHRRNHTLTFTDCYGDVSYVRLFEAPGLDSGERWKEVPTKTIVRRKLQILWLAWYT